MGSHQKRVGCLDLDSWIAFLLDVGNGRQDGERSSEDIGSLFLVLFVLEAYACRSGGCADHGDVSMLVASGCFLPAYDDGYEIRMGGWSGTEGEPVIVRGCRPRLH